MRSAPWVEALDSKHDRTRFACGVPELDRYLKTQAGQDARRRIAAPFVLLMDDGTIGGFYTLSAASIGIDELPTDLVRKLPRYPTLPATLIGRLAVDLRHRGKGWGRHLLVDALFRALRSEIASFAVLVDAKDDAAARFYERESFLRLADRPNRLFLPMAAIERLFENHSS